MVTGYLDRIVYAHRGAFDFGVETDSLTRSRAYLRNKLRGYVRTKFRPNRRASTWFWTDGKDSAVIRRFPSDQGDGRGDRAHVLVGPVGELDVYQALALAEDCPIWTDSAWRQRDQVLEPVSSAMLPPAQAVWAASDAADVFVNDLWPIVRAFHQQPTVPIWVANDMSEQGSTSLIRALIGMADVLAPDDPKHWTFSTMEDPDSSLSIQPEIQFVPGWSGSDVDSNSTRTVVRYDPDHVGDDDEGYRAIVETYLRGGPDKLRRLLQPGKHDPDRAGRRVKDVTSNVTFADHAVQRGQRVAAVAATWPGPDADAMVEATAGATADSAMATDATAINAANIDATVDTTAVDTTTANETMANDAMANDTVADTTTANTTATGDTTNTVDNTDNTTTQLMSAVRKQRPETMSELLTRLVAAENWQLPELVDQIVKAPKVAQEKEALRRELADAGSLTQQQLRRLSTLEFNQNMLRLVEVSLRPDEWSGNAVTQSVYGLVQALGSTGGVMWQSVGPAPTHSTGGIPWQSVSIAALSMLSLLLLTILAFR